MNLEPCFEDKESDFKLTHHKFFQCYCNTSLTHNFFFILQTTITLWKKLNQYIIKWGEHSFFFLSNEELVMNTMTGSHDHSAFLRCWWSHFFLSQQVKTKYLIHSLISNCRKRKWHSTPDFCFLLRFFIFYFSTIKYTAYPPTFLLQCYFDLRFGPLDTYSIGWCSCGCQILLRESAGALSLYYGNGAFRNLSEGVLFGLSPLVCFCHNLLCYTRLKSCLIPVWSLLSAMQLPGLDLWITDTGYVIFSTLISVAVHEFGHAVAAARSVS